MFKERHPRKLSEIVYVGPKAGKDRSDQSGAWYAAIVEFQGGKNGKGAGYMRNSINDSEDVKTITLSLAKQITTQAKRIGNKNAQEVAAKVQASVNSPFAPSVQGLINWKPSP